MRNRFRASYDVSVHGDVIALIDRDRGRSITNDAERVIEDLARAGFDLARFRVVYRDTRSIWDELVTRGGAFAGFASLDAPDLPSAIDKLRSRTARRPDPDVWPC